MIYFGLERARSLDASDERIDKTSFKYVILGFRELQKNLKEFEGRNKDIVCVFVTSERAFVKVRNIGFRRVFMVRTLLELTADDIIEADATPLNLLDISFAAVKASLATAGKQEYVNTMRAVGDVVKAIKDRDAKECARLLSKYGPELEAVSADLGDILKDAKQLVSAKKLHADAHKYKEEAESLKVQLAELQSKLEESKKAVGDSNPVSKPDTAATDDSAELVSLKKQLFEEQESSATIYAKISEELKTASSRAAEAEAREQAALQEKDAAAKGLASTEAQLREQVDAYNAIVAQHNALLEKVATMETSLDEANSVIDGYKQSEADLNANTVIASLKEEIDFLSNKSLSIERLTKMMPVLGSRFALSATKVVVIKEIKNAIYMNSFIEQMNDILRSLVYGERHKTYCIIVLDTLTDQFREFKYKKHGFAINKEPVITDKNDLQVVVTNNFDVAFLKNTLRLNTYDYLVVIDRLKLTAAAVKHSSATVFYLIDSYGDIEDFKLRNENVVLFGESSKYQSPITIPPDGRLFDKRTDERKYSFYRHKSVESILKIAGVI